VPWPNFKNPRARRVAEEYAKRTGGKTLDTNSVYSYDTMLVLADVLERAKTTKADAVVDAIKQTRFTGALAVAVGPVVFNEIGDNPNTGTAMIQILGEKPVVIWPKDSAEQAFVFPRPKR
jgi:branched-chain amino acid transport system substrate-binding protein